MYKKDYRRIADCLRYLKQTSLVPAEWDKIIDTFVVMLKKDNPRFSEMIFRDYLNRGPRLLPTFKGYTVDERVGQFRKMEYGKSMEFIPFDSPKGQALLRDLAETEHEMKNISRSLTSVKAENGQ